MIRSIAFVLVSVALAGPVTAASLQPETPEPTGIPSNASAPKQAAPATTSSVFSGALDFRLDMQEGETPAFTDTAKPAGMSANGIMAIRD